MWTVGAVPAPMFADLLDLAIDWELAALAVALIALVGLGTAAIVRVRRWWQQPSQDPVEQQLEIYQTMLDEGLLDPDEFRRIQDRLEGIDPAPAPPPPDTSIKPGPPPAPPDTSIKP